MPRTFPFVLIPEGYATGSGDWDLTGSAGDWIGGENYAFPQGRNVTGYQFSDDVTWVKGKNTWKFGYAFRRDDITDYTPSEHQVKFGGGENFVLDQGDFAAGLAMNGLSASQSGSPSRSRCTWKASTPRISTSRFRTSPSHLDCAWSTIPTRSAVPIASRTSRRTSAHCRRREIRHITSYLPRAGLRGLFEEQTLGWQPRFGFSYLPLGPGSKTTVRGGFGLFNDYFPAEIMGDLIANVPNVDRFTVLGAAYGTAIAMDPSRADSGHAIAVTSNNALQTLFPQGGYYRNAAGTCPIR